MDVKWTLVLFTEFKIATLFLEYCIAAIDSIIWLAAIVVGVVIVIALVQMACLDSVFYTSFTVLTILTQNICMIVSVNFFDLRTDNSPHSERYDKVSHRGIQFVFVVKAWWMHVRIEVTVLKHSWNLIGNYFEIREMKVYYQPIITLGKFLMWFSVYGYLKIT